MRAREIMTRDAVVPGRHAGPDGSRRGPRGGREGRCVMPGTRQTVGVEQVRAAGDPTPPAPRRRVEDVPRLRPPGDRR
jgi:hypothetical protein